MTNPNQHPGTENAPSLSAKEILEAGASFLERFGVNANPVENHDDFIQAMHQINPRFDGDRDLVRNQLEADQSTWSDDDKDLIMSTVEAMGILKEETPLEGDFDYIVVLGAARQANLDRANYAVEAIKSGTATAKGIIVAGSSRRILPEAERENTANYAPGAETEYDLCAAAVLAASKSGVNLPITLVKVDVDRAQTQDVIQASLKAVESSLGTHKEGRIAAVTTQIYQPTTSLDVARAARGFGVKETLVAGNPSDPAIVAKRTPATYLSEIASALRAASKEQKDKVDRMTAAIGNAKILSNRTLDGESSVVVEENGAEYVVEPDGTRWVSRSGETGLSYDGPDDLVGHYA